MLGCAPAGSGLVAGWSWNLEVDPAATICLLRGSDIDLIERDLLEMVTVEIGERRCSEHVVLHLLRRTITFEDYGQRLRGGWGRCCRRDCGEVVFLPLRRN